MAPIETESLIVGAGVAGLACARQLHEVGRRVAVLEKSRGVGGRCATRRVDGQPVDHGPAFIHGSDPGFLDCLDRLGADVLLEGWPSRVRGDGRPCLPRAFQPGERCVALRPGLSAFPKSLAEGLEVRLGTRVSAARPANGSWEIDDDSGEQHRAAELILTLPVQQTLSFLEDLRGLSRELDGIVALLATMSSMPCLTVLAGYELGEAELDWEMLYPERSGVLHLVSHDSSKRESPVSTVLVYQGLPGWSRKKLDVPPERWTAEILEEARTEIREWAARPLWTQSHRWRYARAGTGNELTRPLLVTLPGGARLGIAGEVCGPGGGVQAAWSSGVKLAGRLTEGKNHE
jgi:predicted NAD/FAD-dependent oxidoreductase